jgi:hypothetical protein
LPQAVSIDDGLFEQDPRVEKREPDGETDHPGCLC